LYIITPLTNSLTMLCPIDQTVLVVTERTNIEIDYCPTCRGVWLDRGELDKLIAGDQTAVAQQEPSAARTQPKHDPTKQTNRNQIENLSWLNWLNCLISDR